jgi:hypothetical protein
MVMLSLNVKNDTSAVVMALLELFRILGYLHEAGFFFFPKVI